MTRISKLHKKWSKDPDYRAACDAMDDEFARKIAVMQRLVDEAEASGVSPHSMDDILKEARRRAGVGGGAHGG